VQRASRALAPGAINVLELLTGAWTAQAIYVAVHRLTRALASRGVLRHRPDGKFTLTSVGKALRTGYSWLGAR
jgi:hypothetical protein